jgi:hypothetical protein
VHEGTQDVAHKLDDVHSRVPVGKAHRRKKISTSVDEILIRTALVRRRGHQDDARRAGRTTTDVRWRLNGFDIDSAGLIFSGERHPVRNYLAAQCWSVTEQTRVGLFQKYGLSTPEDDAPMRNVVAVTGHLDQFG